MNILILLRPVRDPAGFTVNRAAEKIFVNREGFIFNPSDRNALEAGLTLAAELASAGGGVQSQRDASQLNASRLGAPTVTAVAYGGEPAEDLLRQALAMGANRAVLVAEPDWETPDAFALTNGLKRVVAHIGATDLILLGADVVDADLAQVGPRLAEALGWPFVEGAYGAKAVGDGIITLVVADSAASRPRAYRAVQADGPVVASVVRDSNRPRFAPAPQIMRVYTSPQAVERLSLADLELTSADVVPTTRRRGESFPAPLKLGTVLDGADEESVRRVVEALRQG